MHSPRPLPDNYSRLSAGLRQHPLTGSGDRQLVIWRVQLQVNQEPAANAHRCMYTDRSTGGAFTCLSELQ